MTESNESCCSSIDNSSEEDQVTKLEALPNDGEIPVEKNISKTNSQDKGKSKKMKWMPKPVDDMSATEPSSAEGSDQDEDKEYIYTQVCKRINQLTLELDKLCTRPYQHVKPFWTSIKKISIRHKLKVMSALTLVIKDDQVPIIQVDCKVRKHWKPVHNVVIDGGAGVNIMAEHTRETWG